MSDDSDRDTFEQFLKDRRRAGLASLDELIEYNEDPESIVNMNYGVGLAPLGEILTELDDVESIHLASLEAINDNGDDNTSLGSNYLKAWIHNMKINKISRNRKGRKEIVAVASKEPEEKTRTRALREFLFGSGGG